MQRDCSFYYYQHAVHVMVGEKRRVFIRFFFLSRHLKEVVRDVYSIVKSAYANKIRAGCFI